MPRLSECTDKLMWEAGLVSLRELAEDGGVMGGPEWKWCFGGEHDYSLRVQETDVDPDANWDDPDQYEMCSRCNHVRLAPYILIDGVMVSRKPQGDPADPMAVAWPAPKRLALEGPAE